MMPESREVTTLVAGAGDAGAAASVRWVESSTLASFFFLLGPFALVAFVAFVVKIQLGIQELGIQEGYEGSRTGWH